MPAQQPIDRFTYSRNGGGNRDEGCVFRVNIPGVASDTQCTRYKIDVTNLQTQQTWQTTHRYSEFLTLRNELLAHFDKADKKCPGCINFEKVMKLFEFPSKRMFTSKNAAVINYRKKALRAFLALLASHTFTSAPKCPTCSGFPFTSVRDFLTEAPDVRGESISSSGSSGGERDTIRETIQAKNFTTYVPVPKMKPVNSDGAFIRDEDRRTGSSKASSSKPSSLKQSSSTSRSNSQKKAAAKKAQAVDLPSPTSSSPSPLASPPPRPAAIDVHSREDAESFLSFTGRTASPKASNAGTTPRRTSSKKNKTKKKSGSPHPRVQTQQSEKDSQDDEEFGSLNMDFLHNMSIAKE